MITNHRDPEDEVRIPCHAWWGIRDRITMHAHDVRWTRPYEAQIVRDACWLIVEHCRLVHYRDDVSIYLDRPIRQVIGSLLREAGQPIRAAIFDPWYVETETSEMP